jgi:hypothetical protein
LYGNNNLKSEDETAEQQEHPSEETKNGHAEPKAEGAEDEQDQKHVTDSQNDGYNVSTFGQLLPPIASPSKSECEKLLANAAFEPEGASQTPPTAVKTDELDGTTIANGD